MAMRRLRTASTRSLTAVLAATLALVLTATIAQAALTGSAAPPSPKALANAILDAFHAPEPDGLTARIHFTNRLLPSGALPGHGASPLAAGADGRLWIQSSGRFRLELQSDAGDAQIVSDGDRVTVYDASSNTVYRMTLPEGTKDAARPQRHDGEKLTLAKIQRVLDRLAERWTVSGAEPGTAAGRPAYTVKISPKAEGGLLGAAQVAWDAVRGAPLRAAVYARGESDPVLELAATEVSYDAVPDAAIDVAPPAGAKVTDLTAGDRDHARARGRDAAPSSVAASDRLAGLPLTRSRPVTLDGQRGALAVYGKGLGAIAVLRRAAGTRTEGAPRRRDDDRSLRLPRVDVDGASATELATPLGTIVTFERDGVAYVVAGSVPRAAAEKVARALP
jgi:outer membrane lipoprotein-sorting protein